MVQMQPRMILAYTLYYMHIYLVGYNVIISPSLSNGELASKPYKSFKHVIILTI